MKVKVKVVEKFIGYKEVEIPDNIKDIYNDTNNDIEDIYDYLQEIMPYPDLDYDECLHEWNYKIEEKE